jgi:hypothetical protein
MAYARQYLKLFSNLSAANVNYESHTIKCALMDVAYVPNQGTDEFWDDISGDEVTGSGYAQVTLTGKDVVASTTSNITQWLCDNPAFASMTVTGIRYAVFYRDSGTPSTSPLISYIDFEQTYDLTAQTGTVVVPSSGILNHLTA